jgi:hypothetical protein
MARCLSMIMILTGFTFTNVSHAQMLVKNSEGDSLMIITEEGKIGIGTAKPIYRFHVACGIMQFDSSATARSSNAIQIQGSRLIGIGSPPKPPTFNPIFIDGGDFGSPVVLASRSGNTGIGIKTPTAKLDVNGSTGYNQLRLRLSFTPSNSGDSRGSTGDIAWDNNYIYVKTSSGWKRAALSTF